MSDAGKAVFLSYASQDAEAAKKVCDALRAAGVEVWFDQNELVGGDAWDQKIRKQIKECGLLIPIISKTTQGRREAYFRLEWKLADERTHLMAKGTPFLLPITIDETSDREALVPEAFLAVQWTKAPGGEVPPSFAARVKRLLNSNTGVADPDRAARDEAPGLAPPAMNAASRRPRWIVPAVISLAAVVAALAWMLSKSSRGRAGAELSLPSFAAASPQSPVESPARTLAQQVFEMVKGGRRDQLVAAEEIARKAMTLDATDAEVWAASAEVDALMVYFNYDGSEARRQQAQQKVAKAIAFAPGSFNARRVQAVVFGHVVRTPKMVDEAARIFRELAAERPQDWWLLTQFGAMLQDAGRFDEAIPILERSGDRLAAGWTYFIAERYPEARKIADRLLAEERTEQTVLFKAHVEWIGAEDLDAAQAAIDRFTPAELLRDDPVMVATVVALYRHDAERVIELLTAFPREWLTTRGFVDPKRYWIGLAHELAGRSEAARAEWRVALQLTEARLRETPNDTTLLLVKANLLARLDEPDEARRAYELGANLGQLDPKRSHGVFTDRVLLRLGRKDVVLARLEQLFRDKPSLWTAQHCNARYMPEFAPLHGDPRFQQLLRGNLPPGAKPFDGEQPEAKP